MNLSLNQITSFFILDSQGKPLLQKNYTQTAPNIDQIFQRTAKKSNDIVLVDNHLVLYKPVLDTYFYLTASPLENEIMLFQLLNSFIAALEIQLKQVEKRSLVDNMDVLLLMLDETIDDGYAFLIFRIILQIDPQEIAGRNSVRETAKDQTLANVWKQAQQQFKSSFLP
jgi:coatomer subunit zeta